MFYWRSLEERKRAKNQLKNAARCRQSGFHPTKECVSLPNTARRSEYIRRPDFIVGKSTFLTAFCLLYSLGTFCTLSPSGVIGFRNKLLHQQLMNWWQPNA